MKKWNVLPILFLISGFAQAQGFNIQKSSEKIDSLVSQVKKVKSDVEKGEASQLARKGQIATVCNKITEAISLHNSSIGKLGIDCSRADVDLKSKQGLLEEAIEKLKNLKSELAGTERAIDQLNKQLNQDFGNGALDKKISEFRRARNVAAETLKKLAVYDKDEKLISGELKKKKDERRSIFSTCLDNEEYSLGAYDRCSVSEEMIKIHKEVEIIETTISTLKTSIGSLKVQEDALVALRAKPLKDRNEIFRLLISTQTAILDKLKKGIAEQTTTVTSQKLQVVLAQKEFSKANSSAGKGTCKSLGVKAMPKECSF